jgi:hypothetical protein
MKRLLFVSAIALVVAPALASPQVMPVKGMKYAVYNPATGELTPTEGPVRYGPSIWAATERSGYYFIQQYYGPGYTSLCAASPGIGETGCLSYTHWAARRRCSACGDSVEISVARKR